jgi:hypothetical protein
MLSMLAVTPPDTRLVALESLLHDVAGIDASGNVTFARSLVGSTAWEIKARCREAIEIALNGAAPRPLVAARVHGFLTRLVIDVHEDVDGTSERVPREDAAELLRVITGER